MGKNIMNYNELPIPTFGWVKANHLELEDVNYTKKEFKNISFLKGTEDNVNKIPENFSSKIPNKYEGTNKVKLDEAILENSVRYHISTKENEEVEYFIDFKLDKENPTLIGFLSIVASGNSKINLILSFEDDAKEDYYINFLSEITTSDEAEVNITKIQNNNSTTRHIEQRYTDIHDVSRINYTTINLGGKESILNYSTNLIGDNSFADIKAVYIGEGNSLTDFSNKLNFFGKKTEGNLEVRGVLKDHARKYFRGTLEYMRGSSKSVGGEEESVLLLDKTAKSFAIPILLCGEDDVIGEHAASTGQIDSEKLFYLMTRGFDKDFAKKLIVESTFRPVIDSIDNEEIRALSLEKVHNKIFGI